MDADPDPDQSRSNIYQTEQLLHTKLLTRLEPPIVTTPNISPPSSQCPCPRPSLCPVPCHVYCAFVLLDLLLKTALGYIAVTHCVDSHIVQYTLHIT